MKYINEIYQYFYVYFKLMGGETGSQQGDTTGKGGRSGGGGTSQGNGTSQAGGISQSTVNFFHSDVTQSTIWCHTKYNLD